MDTQNDEELSMKDIENIHDPQSKEPVPVQAQAYLNQIMDRVVRGEVSSIEYESDSNLVYMTKEEHQILLDQVKKYQSLVSQKLESKDENSQENTNTEMEMSKRLENDEISKEDISNQSYEIGNDIKMSQSLKQFPPDYGNNKLANDKVSDYKESSHTNKSGRSPFNKEERHNSSDHQKDEEGRSYNRKSELELSKKSKSKISKKQSKSKKVMISSQKSYSDLHSSRKSNKNRTPKKSRTSGKDSSKRSLKRGKDKSNPSIPENSPSEGKRSM